MTTDTISVASKISFNDLCVICERISTKQGRDKKQEALKNFITKWRNFHSDLHKNNPKTTDSFYPAMRLLLPHLDKERGAYGLKEKTFATKLIKILGIAKDSEDALKLLNFRAPQSARADAGDFAAIAYFVVKSRHRAQGNFSIEDVNGHLDTIALSHAERKQGVVLDTLEHLVQNMSPEEQKWLIRIVMKNMKFGLSDQLILSTYHPDARESYDNSSSLLKLCIALRDPNVRGHEIAISLFSPFRPMLAETATPDKIGKVLMNKTYYCETKHDGERMQLHTDGKKFMYFSRNSNDFTDSFGGTSTEGPLTCHIANCFNPNVKNCILDGEMVGYNFKTNLIGSKGENFDVKYLKDDVEYHPCYCVFDIVMYNDKVLTNLPLMERLNYLKDLFTPLEGRLLFTPRSEIRLKQDAIDALNNAIEKREEGIVIKDPSSIYKPNQRKAGWYKIKPDYVDELMEQLDLIIIGGNFGEGRRRGLTSHFLLGVAVKPKIPGEHPTVFHSVARVGSGYSFNELYELCMQLNQHWQPYDKRNPPGCIVIGSGHKERPDLWIEPSKSKIVQVKAAEITRSDKFMTGYTLRFPRVEKIRYDKEWYECMTVEEFEQLRTQCEGKLASRMEDSGEPSPKKPRVVRERQSAVVQFKGPDGKNITKVSDIFKGKEICVTARPGKEKMDIETEVLKQGGTVVMHPKRNTFCVIAPELVLRARNIIALRKHDVVKCDWFKSCIEEQRLIPWSPLDMWFATKKTADAFTSSYDQFGDSYTEDTNTDKLKYIFEQMKEAKLDELDQRDILHLENEYFPNSSHLGLFRACVAHFDSNSKSLCRMKYEFYGGFTKTRLEKDVSHAIVNSNDLTNLGALNSLNRSRTKKFHIVTEEWVEKCVKNKVLQPEKNFRPIQ